MAHLPAVVVAGDLGLPIAAHNLQRIVKSEQKFHILVIAGVQQLRVELLDGGDLWGHGNQLRNCFFLKRFYKICVVFIQPLLQGVLPFTAHRAPLPFRGTCLRGGLCPMVCWSVLTSMPRSMAWRISAHIPSVHSGP